MPNTPLLKHGPGEVRREQDLLHALCLVAAAITHGETWRRSEVMKQANDWFVEITR
jgi:hypothetical protein